MKKRFLIIMIMLCVFAFTGCAKVIEMTDEQNDMVAEYAAGVLIQRSYSYKLKYPNVSTDVPTTEETKPSEKETTASDSQEESTTVDNSVPDKKLFGEVLGVAPVELTYNDYKIVDEYPDDPDAMLSFQPQDGCKFIILEFTLHNPTEDSLTVNTAKSKPVFRATIDKKRCNNYANLMLNDITNLDDVTIKAGEDYEGILIFMVDENVIANMKSFSISTKINDVNTEVLKLK